MDDHGGTGLPASIEAAWGVRGRPARGPRPALSLDRIVAAAVKVAAADGMGAVSMSRIAAELGVSTMSLYRYVAAKDELLALMTDAAFDPPPRRPAPGEGWRDALERWARAELAAYRRNPWVLRIPVKGPPTAPNQVAWLERGLACLAGTGLREDEKLSVILLLTGYDRNQAALEADIAAAMAAGEGQPMTSYGRTLARLIDPERFPALHAAIAAGVLDAAEGEVEEDDMDSEFSFGLERVLDGIETLIEKRRTGRG